MAAAAPAAAPGPSVRDLGVTEAVAVGASVLVRLPDRAGWYAGTALGPSGAGRGRPLRVTLVDGSSVAVGRADLRAWARPQETAWHRKRKHLLRASPGSSKRRASPDPNIGAAARSVDQIDVETGAAIGRFANAKKAAEACPWIPEPADVVSCCRGVAPEAGGFKWRFALEQRPRIEASDVTDILNENVAITIQAQNPKKPKTVSHDLYEKYKTAKTVREMLALGGRRADVSYDIAHGWITFDDDAVAKRYAVRTTVQPPDGGNAPPPAPAAKK